MTLLLGAFLYVAHLGGELCKGTTSILMAGTKFHNNRHCIDDSNKMALLKQMMGTRKCVLQ